MLLFENEILNITRILNVAKVEASEKAEQTNLSVDYSPNLRVYELVFFVTSGSETSFCGVNILDCPGSLRYMPKGKNEGTYKVKNIKKGYCIDVYFDTEDEMPSQAIGFLQYDFLTEKFIKLYNVWSEKKTDYYLRSMEIFYDIIRSIKNAQAKYLPSEKQKRLDMAHKYMIENYCSENFDYGALCEATGLGYSYFSELFAAKYKMSPVKYVTKLKLDRAKELLITGKYSIGEISEMCGFSSVYYFSSVFKKSVGISPKNYKP